MSSNNPPNGNARLTPQQFPMQNFAAGQQEQADPAVATNGFNYNYAPTFSATTYPSHYYQSQPPQQPHASALNAQPSHVSVQGQSGAAPQAAQFQQQQQQFYPQFQQQFQTTGYPQARAMSQSNIQQPAAPAQPMSNNYAVSSKVYSERYAAEFSKMPPKMQSSAAKLSQIAQQQNGHSMYRPVVPQAVHEQKMQASMNYPSPKQVVLQPQQTIALPSIDAAKTSIQTRPMRKPKGKMHGFSTSGMAERIQEPINYGGTEEDPSDIESVEAPATEDSSANHKQTIDQLDKLNKRNYGMK